MITKQTATNIAYAYREIESAEKLLAEITEALRHKKAPDIRDAFGRMQDGLQLGVPTGESSLRLFNVAWPLAKVVIEAHIAQQKAVLSALNEKARIEASTDGETPNVP